MNKISKINHIYIILIIFMLVISVIGSTYAYLTATTRSGSDVGAGSRGYSLSMGITPIYNDFSMIPMDDEDVMKGLRNQCKDKYDRGSCHAYNINVYDFDDAITAISGSINVSTNNISNLSYMVFEESDEDDDNSCITINSINYCVLINTNRISVDTDMSLGDNINVAGMSEKNLLLVLWLSNLNESQNEYDVGDYNAEVTMSLGGNGGEIKGNINGIINNELQSEE